MNFDPGFLPYSSIRYPLYAQHGMVASSSPQASAAGLAIMRKGGNAIDAAVAAATTLTVVEPTSNGIGSDAFALVWIERDKKLYGLNGSGWAPAAISIEKVKERISSQKTRMPIYGWIATMVPGAPKAWAELISRFGKLSLMTIMEPAIDYARNGYPVGANLARMWQRAFDSYYRTLKGAEFGEWFRTFAPEGHAPKAGDIVRLPYHAYTLKLIGESNAKAFYNGELIDRIIADSQEFGGFFCKADFEEYEASWVEPVSLNYRGYTICEIPPNSQGIVALMALNILKEFRFEGLQSRKSAETFHILWEAMKIAFADGLAYITDPKAMCLDYKDLLSPDYGTFRAREINPKGLARLYTNKIPPKTGTVYLCTADGEGNMVSYIQSNYMGFGSGIVIRGTGISLQNRGADFSLDPKHPNCLAPHKKTYHTIIPGFLLKDSQALGPFGVMGGYMQPQGHVQVVTNMIDFNLNPQQALDAPRWQWISDKKFLIEKKLTEESLLDSVSKPDFLQELRCRGHDIEISEDHTLFGRGQIILRLSTGALIGATEGRTDSNISCW